MTNYKKPSKKHIPVDNFPEDLIYFAQKWERDKRSLKAKQQLLMVLDLYRMSVESQ